MSLNPHYALTFLWALLSVPLYASTDPATTSWLPVALLY